MSGTTFLSYYELNFDPQQFQQEKKQYHQVWWLLTSRFTLHQGSRGAAFSTRSSLCTSWWYASCNRRSCTGSVRDRGRRVPWNHGWALPWDTTVLSVRRGRRALRTGPPSLASLVEWEEKESLIRAWAMDTKKKINKKRLTKRFWGQCALFESLFQTIAVFKTLKSTTDPPDHFQGTVGLLVTKL